ncbi:MAG: hypothetical protein NVS4B11_05960 [Ktedonobacteraceae bacterium]
MASNGYYGQQSGDLRATLAISQNEASYGTTRMLNFPDGRMVQVTIPVGTRSGQEIRLEGQGQQITNGGPLGALILTVSIAHAESFGSQPYPLGGTNIPTEFIAPPPPVQPSYPGSNQGSNFSNYPAQGQTPPLYVNQQGTTQAATPPSYAPNAPYYATQGQPLGVPPQKRRPSRRPLIATIAIAVLAALLIVGSFLYYSTVYQPQQQHVQATATVGAQIKNANTTGTAQAVATTRAQLDATATVEAKPLSDYTNITAKQPDLLNDPLSSPDTRNWDTGTNCTFTGGAYHVTETQNGFFYDCAAKATNFSHFLFQVKMTFLKGDYGGIIFRADFTNSKFYLLRIDRSTGGYDLYLYVDKEASHAKRLLSSTTSSFKADLNQPNQIAVLARGAHIALYVNSTYIDAVDDNTFGSGQIGVFAEDNQNPAEVSFEQAQVWAA